MKTTDISLLGYALLGLIQQKPRSGYDLRKTFAESAMGNYSSSPGAIYPALERLQVSGVVRSEVQETVGLRRRRVFRITRTGEAELKNWLGQPIVRADVMRGAGDLLLRFAFLEPVLGAEAAVTFLQSFRAELKAYVPELKSYLRQNEQLMPLSGRLALESGISGYTALQKWTEHAISTYLRSQSSSVSALPKSKSGDSR
jgi:DNA-binding PadR family transcriptional regulator